MVEPFGQCFLDVSFNLLRYKEPKVGKRPCASSEEKLDCTRSPLHFTSVRELTLLSGTLSLS